MAPPEQTIPEPSSHLRTLADTECLELLTSTTVGRVAFVSADGLQLVPLNFAVIDGEVYFRTAEGTVLDYLSHGGREVAFGVDHHSPVSRDGWNVTVKGNTSRVVDPQTVEKVMSWSKLRPWAGGTRDVVIHLQRVSTHGRRVHGA